MKKITLLLTTLMMAILLAAPALAKTETKWICHACKIWVSGTYCPQCTANRPANFTDKECLLTLNIDFQKNVIFAKYDVEVVVNGKQMYTIGHGGTLNETVVVPKGLCEIVVRKAENHAIDARICMNISRDDAYYSGEVVSHVLYLTLTDVDSNVNVANYALSLGQRAIADGVSIQVLSVKESRGNTTIKPADGYVFLFVEFEFVNMRDGIASVNLKSSRCELDGYIIQPSSHAEEAAPMGHRANMLEDEKAKAMLCFEVPTNWNELEIVYVFSDDIIGFTLTN